MGSKAKLIIKAANGSVADFRVDAQLEWTVHDLKSHLYRYYPSHPPLQSQKLIHSGRLLMEHETVREIVPERGDNPLVIHLVAYERSSSLPAVTTSRNVSRQASRQPSVPPLEETDAEHTPPPAQPERQNQAPPPAPPTSATPTTAAPTTATPTTSPAQHSQTDPWLRYRGLHGFQAQGIPPAAHLVQNFAPGMAGYPVPPFYMSPYGAAYAVNAAQMAQWYNYYARPPPGAPAAAADPSTEDLDLEPDNAQEPPNNNQDVEEDMPMNGGLGMMAGGNPQRQRDVVDHMYMLMMAGFLLAVAYITGSVGRLLVFAAGVLFMLLNQAGWFSLQRVRPAEQPNPQPNPEPNPGAEEPQEEQQAGEGEAGEGEAGEGEAGDTEATEGQDNTQTETDGPDNNNDTNSSQTPEEQLVPEPPREPERPGLLATIFVFITSFFTSLLPQQPPELQMN